MPGCNKSNSSPLEWARFHSAKHPATMRWPSVSIRRDRHTNRRAGDPHSGSPPDAPGVRNNHHDLERLAESAEAIGNDPLEGRAHLGLVVNSASAGGTSPRLSVTWSAVRTKTSDLDGRSIAALPILSCVREQTPSQKAPKLLRPGITIRWVIPCKRIPSPIAVRPTPILCVAVKIMTEPTSR